MRSDRVSAMCTWDGLGVRQFDGSPEHGLEFGRGLVEGLLIGEVVFG
jgi:hypothetical protein